MTQEEKENLLEVRLAEIQLKYSKEFQELEKQERGAGDINWHTAILPQNSINLLTVRVFKINDSSIMPKHIQNEIMRVASEILSE